MELQVNNDSVSHGNYTQRTPGAAKEAMRCLYINNVMTSMEYTRNGVSKYLIWFGIQLAIKLNQHQEFMGPGTHGKIKRVYLLTADPDKAISKVARANLMQLEVVENLDYHKCKFFVDLPDVPVKVHGNLITGQPFDDDMTADAYDDLINNVLFVNKKTKTASKPPPPSKRSRAKKTKEKK